jgi:hypothetical protein
MSVQVSKMSFLKGKKKKSVFPQMRYVLNLYYYCYYYYCYYYYGPELLLSIANDYGMDHSGIEFRCGRKFSHPSGAQCAVGTESLSWG